MLEFIRGFPGWTELNRQDGRADARKKGGKEERRKGRKEAPNPEPIRIRIALAARTCGAAGNPD